MWALTQFLLFFFFLSSSLATLSSFDRSALVFEKPGDHVKCTDCLDLGTHAASKSFTMEIWLRIDTWPKDMAWAFMHGGPCSPNQCLFLGFRGDGAATLGFIVNDLIAARDFRKDKGVWTHWAATYDSTSLERNLYRNGELVQTDIATSPYSPDSNDVYFGSDNMQNNRFQGAIDEARFWVQAVLPRSTLQTFMCSPQSDRFVDDSHPFRNRLAARFVFLVIGQHVANTVNMNNPRIKFAGRRPAAVEGVTLDDETRVCGT